MAAKNLLNPAPYYYTKRGILVIVKATYTSDSFGWLSKWKSVPVDVLSSQAIQVHDTLLTWGAVNRPHILLSEHGVVLNWLSLLCPKLFNQLHQIFQLLKNNYQTINSLTYFSSCASFLRVPSLSANMFSRFAINSFNLSIKFAYKFARSCREAFWSISSYTRVFWVSKSP